MFSLESCDDIELSIVAAFPPLGLETLFVCCLAPKIGSKSNIESKNKIESKNESKSKIVTEIESNY